MKIKLTEKSIKALVLGAKPYEVYDETLIGMLLRVQPSGVMSFYVAYRNKQGVKNRVRLGQYGQITLTQARDLAKQHLGAIAGGVDPQQEKKAVIAVARKIKEEEMTLKGFIDQHYKPWVTSNRKSAEHTMMLLSSYFAHWYETPMSQLTRMDVEEWQLSERQRGLEPSSINRTLNALRSVFTRAIGLGILDVNPLSKVPKLQEPKEIHVRYLTEDEEHRLLDALAERDKEAIRKRQSGNEWCKERNYQLHPVILPHQYGDYLTPLVVLTMNTGMRRGEVLQLKWRDVDLINRRLTIRAANAKANKTRHIPLNNKAITALTVWRETCAPDTEVVFPSPSGGAMTVVKTAWVSLLEQAGIEDFRFHDLRHHFASKLAMNGTDLNTVRELLGHSDFSTTLRYAHLADNHKADAVALL